MRGLFLDYENEGFPKQMVARDIGGRPEHAVFEKGGAWIWELPA
jgi:hypothetical protein